MKKKLLLTSLLLPILLFSYELDFNKSFSKVVNPDLLTTNINVIVEKIDEDKVNSEIEKFNDFIKTNNEVKIKNGSYTLSPKYKYHNNKQEFVGYVGSLRYTAESKNAKKINSFMDELISIKNRIKSDDIKLDISNVSWNISEELQNKSFDDLRFESIVWIENYSVELSTKLSKRCELKRININDSHGINPMYARNEMAFSSMSKSVADVAPVSSEQNIIINPNFLLECR